jgi:hypothetical protein
VMPPVSSSMATISVKVPPVSIAILRPIIMSAIRI